MALTRAKVKNRRSMRLQAQGLIVETPSHRGVCLSTRSLSNQQVHAQAVYLYAGELITGIKSMVASSAGSNVTRLEFGLYDASASPVLLASSGDVKALITGTNVEVVAPFTTAYKVVKDGIYFVALLATATTTVPQFFAPSDRNQPGSSSGAFGTAVTENWCWYQTAQASLPNPATPVVTFGTQAPLLTWMGLY